MSDVTAILGARLFDGQDWHEGKALLVDGGRIVGLQDHAEVPDSARRIDADGQLLVPGFIDLQVNGGGGVLLNDRPDVEAIAAICTAHARFGTTALLPTLITDRPEMRTAAIAAGRQARDAGVPGFIGLHLEGPHLSVARKGVHDPALIRPMEATDLAEILDCAQDFAALMVTVAPENVSLDQVAAMAAVGVTVSLGHSDTGYQRAKDYAGAGARTVTHLFNAMSPLGHREPGLVGAALGLGQLHAGIIADGFHVDPAALGIALRAKSGPGHVFLVTDAMSTIGSDKTGFLLNGRQIYRSGGRLTLADGTLAGADIDMLASVRFLVDHAIVSLEEALRMASLYPAEAIRLQDRKGRLAAGLDADFVLLTPDLKMVSTWIGGSAVFVA